MAVSVRGRSSVMPCLDQYGRLSTLCLLLSWQLPAHRGAVGSVVLDILSSFLGKEWFHLFYIYSIGQNIRCASDTMRAVF